MFIAKSARQAERVWALPARPFFQLCFAHRHACGVGADIEDWHGFAVGQRLVGGALLPLLGRRPDLLHQALNLAGR